MFFAGETVRVAIADGWARVAEDPGPLLSTGIVSSSWLDEALPTLLEVAGPAVIAGDQLCHFDVRSDNMCFRADGSAVLVDWNLAEIGNARLDVAFWLPSLALEGGPAPESVLAGCRAGGCGGGRLLRVALRPTGHSRRADRP